MPAATSSAAVVNAITIAVPMSGWVATSRQAAPTTISSGLASSRRSCTRWGRRASSVAAYSTSASFISSEGWNWSGPAPIQRRAPLTRTPTCGTCTASTSTNDDASSGAVIALHFGDPVAGEHAHHDQADRPVGDELDQIALPLPALQQRRGRGGAVDHHRAERQQAQRRGQQDAVLERLRDRPGRVRRSRCDTRAATEALHRRPGSVRMLHRGWLRPELPEPLAAASKSLNWSKLAAGRATAARPLRGRAAGFGRRRRRARASPQSVIARARPASAAAISAAPRRSGTRPRSSPGRRSRSGAKSWPLPWPPRIRWIAARLGERAQRDLACSRRSSPWSR